MISLLLRIAMTALIVIGLSAASVAKVVPDTAAKAGGETFATAVVVPSLPYTDSGDICGANNDYVLPCGYTDGGDLVYAYTPTVQEILVIDLCNSSFDTAVAVYEDVYSGTAHACNDDGSSPQPSCGHPYISYLETLVTPGHTYYIVVDISFGACDDYTLELSSEVYVPCLECPPGATDEGEGEPPSGYLDAYNSGCDRSYNAFTPVTLPASGCTHVCGIAGNFESVPGFYWYDSDWYELTATTDMLGISSIGDGHLYVTVHDPQPDCTNLVPVGSYIGDPCEVHEQTFAVTAGHVYWVEVYFEWMWVNPWPAVDAPADYVLSFCSFDVVAEEKTSWGAVKALFR